MAATADLLERVRETGLLAAGRPVVVLLSGGRDSVCLLDVAVRLAGADAVSALHVDYGLRAQAAGDAAHCRALCERLGVALDVHVARRPEDAGNLQAWARDVRLSTGARMALERGALLATGHTATDQAETVLYRLAASPGRRALLGMAARDGLLVRPLLGVTREQTAAHCTARGLRWREDASNDDPAYARNRAARRARAGAAPSCTRRRRPTSCARPSCCATRRRCSTRSSQTALAGRDHIAIDHLAALPPALGRLVVRRLAEDAAGRLCARAPGRLAHILALGDGALDLGDGARAVVAGGVLRVQPTPPGRSAPAAPPCRRSERPRRRLRPPPAAARAGPTLLHACATTPWGRSSSSPMTSPGAYASSARQITADYEGRDLLLVGVLKGAVFFLSDLMRHIDVPCEVDFMAVASYGSSTDSSGVVRILKDLDVPIEGRHVLIVEDIVDSGLTLQYLLRNLGARDPRSIEVCALLTKPERRKVVRRAALRRLRDPQPLRRRLRPRSRRALPQPALRRGARRKRSGGVSIVLWHSSPIRLDQTPHLLGSHFVSVREFSA